MSRNSVTTDQYMAMSPAEQFAYQRKRFGAMRRLVAEHIAQEMRSGQHARQHATWVLAEDLDDAGLDLDYLIRKCIEAAGANFEQVWVRPPQQVARARELETALDQGGLSVDKQVDRLVLEEMRRPPCARGSAGRLDDMPF
jgi:hypothetical protein